MNYELGSFLVNAQSNLGLYQLLNLLQDAATTHAHNIGIGLKEMEEMKMFWVLTRQNLIMKRWPKWHDEISIKTWIRIGDGAASNRDFHIFQNEEIIGECTTSWLALSSDSRRPIAWDRNSHLGKLQNEGRVSIDTAKIPIRSGGQKLLSFAVRNSDIDQNMHVNNTKYAQWILDAIPFEDHNKYNLAAYEVNFLLETKLNDLITIERTHTGPDVHFQGVRESDQIVVFTAILRIKQ
ncbi:MAG TPA: acyl-ACP thioesterase domain-containing protein [Bacteriovoracaceae bacterium]|nr:acyl-ACP thioesterase domain-containing protein [Bacteriovoracaceae bacterium]